MSRTVRQWHRMPNMRRFHFAGQKAYCHARDDLKEYGIVIPRYAKPVAWDDVYCRAILEMPNRIWQWQHKRLRPQRTWRKSIRQF
jgi:hypothetical protein